LRVRPLASQYGDEWHNQGIIEKKQNVFDDFHYAAKALTSHPLNVTVPQKLMIMGGSNGGLLVGACVNQAPELYGAAVAQVGVLDMYRFTKFTIGSAWVSDYGDPDKAEDFRHLVKYSPLHNTFSPAERGLPYPAIMLTTGSHDDRVVPLHSLKFAATLQERVSEPASAAIQGDVPILLRVDIKAGHGAGKPTTKIIDEMADVMTFAALTLKVTLEC
jgi:prolyl oligopeptidase